MKTPDTKEISFTYISFPEKDPACCWRAVLSFPAGAVAETPLLLSVVNGHGESVRSGVMELSGRKIEVVEGRGTLLYSDFIAGIREKKIAFVFQGGRSVRGALTFA